MRKYKKILIVRTDRIGDIVLSTPVVKVLKDKYPESHIAFMVRPYTKDILQGNPYLDEIIIYDKYGKHKSLWATFKFARSLKKKKFDLALILHPTNRVHIISYLAGIPERIGYDKKLAFLLTEKIKDLKHQGKKHESEYNFDILKKIGIGETSDDLYMPVFKEDTEFINEIFKEYNLEDKRKTIAINPTASCPSKIWPTERFGKAARKIVKKYKVKIALLCSDKDKQLCIKVASYLNKEDYIEFVNLELRQLAALLKKASLLISNDSGPVHIAVAVKTPVISIFGRNQAGLSPRRWRPLGEKDVVLHKEVGCKQCLAHNCNIGFKCLKDITVEDILNATERFKENITG